VADPDRWELLSGLSSEERAAVMDKTARRLYRSKDVVFHEGDVGDTLFIIVRGHLAVRMITAAGESTILTILGPGQVTGEMALLRRSALRTASVVALDAVETRALHRHDFFRLCDEQPTVERLMIGLLASRVDRLSRHLVEALHVPVEQRLVRRLVETARLYDSGPDGVVLPLTQQDMAQLAGTTRPTANAVLRDLENEGLLRLRRGQIQVTDLSRLTSRGL
jgi:CRP-like cAMP-binding protein